MFESEKSDSNSEIENVEGMAGPDRQRTVDDDENIR